MGYGDGYYYGQGKFICNTANLLQGDVIRVRSLTDTSKVWNKTVASTDAPIIFDVPGKDYYRICLVQDIDGTPTEIGGTNYPIHYGFVQYVDVLDKTTLGGIQGILNANQQATLLSVGDEVNLTVNGAQEKWLVAHINPSNASYPSNSVILCRKEVYGAIKITNKHYKNGNLKSYMADFYNMISENDRAYIKQKTVNAAFNASTIDTSIDNYVWSPTSWETNATVNTNETSTNVPFTLFATAVGRTRGGNYWTASGYQNGGGMVYVNANGVNSNSGDLTSTYATLPCIMLTADS